MTPRKPEPTLPDRPCKVGGVLLVGINPSRVSVAAGHYYQGRLGKRLWGRLRRLGLLEQTGHDWEDEAFVAAGNGLTDLVKRPTARAAELSREEREAGRGPLAEKVRAWRPGLLLFAFGPPAEALLEGAVRPGRGPDFEGVPVFRLSGPYASGEETAACDATLHRLLAARSVAPDGQRIALPAPAEAHSAASGEAAGPAAGPGGPTQRVTAALESRHPG